MNILITGTDGFIGNAVANCLSGDGHQITGLVREERSSLLRSFPVIAWDLSDDRPPVLENKGYDALIHCAGLAHQPYGTPEQLFADVNVKGTHNIAAAAARAGVKRFIHISSVSVYGHMGYQGWADEETECKPIGAYARSKLDSESAVQEVFEGTSTRYVLLRPATVIGEGDRGNIRTLIEMLDENRFLFVGSGANLKSFVYLDDLAGAISALLMYYGSLAPIYNVTSEPIAVSEVVLTICEELGRKAPSIHLPAKAVAAGIGLIAGLVPHRRLKSAAAGLEKWLSEDAFSGKRLSGMYQIKITAKDAIRREVRWYKAQK